MGTLGERFDPLGEHLQDPYSFYAHARMEEPVFYWPKMNAWVITRYPDVYAALRDSETFSNASAIRTLTPPPLEVFQEFAKLGYPPMPATITSDGEEHERLRLPYSRTFTADKVARTEQFMRARVEACIDNFLADGQVDLMSALIHPLQVAVVTFMYGAEELDEQMVDAGVEGFLVLHGKLAARGAPIQEQVEAVKATTHLIRALKDVVEHRRVAPREADLVTMFAAAVVPHDQPMTIKQESQIVVSLAGGLLAGQTTSPQLGTGILHLLENREQWQLLCARPELIPQAVEEFCRYDSSVTGAFRAVKATVTIAGQEIPSGDNIFLALPSANRDESLCERPEQFDITRRPTKHLTFGYRRHYCIGAETARWEMRIALETLTRRLPTLRLSDRPVEIEPIFVSRGPSELWVEW